ncbi:MAG: hypothetical protein HRT47_05310 [Candidatus Caenarcaniphilales bacterium]|nr:hypothetical protein [Candidatus Caenarcaniphilales bacterium]
MFKINNQTNLPSFPSGSLKSEVPIAKNSVQPTQRTKVTSNPTHRPFGRQSLGLPFGVSPFATNLALKAKETLQTIEVNNENIVCENENQLYKDALNQIHKTVFKDNEVCDFTNTAQLLTKGSNRAVWRLDFKNFAPLVFKTLLGGGVKAENLEKCKDSLAIINTLYEDFLNLGIENDKQGRTIQGIQLENFHQRILEKQKNSGTNKQYDIVCLEEVKDTKDPCYIDLCEEEIDKYLNRYFLDPEKEYSSEEIKTSGIIINSAKYFLDKVDEFTNKNGIIPDVWGKQNAYLDLKKKTVHTEKYGEIYPIVLTSSFIKANNKGGIFNNDNDLFIGSAFTALSRLKNIFKKAIQTSKAKPYMLHPLAKKDLTTNSLTDLVKVGSNILKKKSDLKEIIKAYPEKIFQALEKTRKDVYPSLSEPIKKIEDNSLSTLKNLSMVPEDLIIERQKEVNRWKTPD